MNPRVTLHAYHQSGLSLQDALAALPHNATLQGYCISPAAFNFARYAGQLDSVEPLAIDQVYEARFFNAQVELRWLRDPAGGGEGSAVWLAEQPLHLPQGWHAAPLPDLIPLPDSHRVLTGTLASPADRAGWQTLNAPRHGTLCIPLDVPAPGQRPAWRVREYLGPAPGTAGEDGNHMVVEERLIGLEPLLAQAQSTGG